MTEVQPTITEEEEEEQEEGQQDEEKDDDSIARDSSQALGTRGYGRFRV